MAAAGRERRAERLNERLRGAQRTNIGDDSFNLNIDGLGEPAAESSSSPRQTPSTVTGKRKRADQDVTQESQKSNARPSTVKPSPIPAEAPVQLPQLEQSSSARTRRSERRNGSSARSRRSSERIVPVVASRISPAADELEAVMAAPTMQSPPRSQQSRAMLEEVEESPAHAPGSGRRRNVQLDVISESTLRLQNAMSTDDMAPPSSSPLARKSRRSDGAASTLSRRSAASMSRISEGTESLGAMPDQSPGKVVDDQPETSEPIAEESAVPEPEQHPEEAEPESSEAEVEAEAIGSAEAARALGRRRSRRSMRTSSPELGSGPADLGQPEREPVSEDSPERDRPSPVVPRRATQKTTRAKTQASSKSKEPPQKKQRKRRPAPDKPTSNRRKSGDAEAPEDDDDAIEITVQRFVNLKKRSGEADELDPLQAAIPFANRTGESVIDVLAQVCDEVITSTLAQFQQVADAADSAVKKKECRIKMRTLEAYRTELSSRLLQHTIHLNHWHSLRKQVRQAHKEKLSLREEIIRLKGEREQVALRMDAVRIKHEADSKESTYRINTSALMHDIDVAVERGREAPELSRGAQKDAEIANLELRLAQVADEACSASSHGGMLRQVQDFNAFLERAAQALESRL